MKQSKDKMGSTLKTVFCIRYSEWYFQSAQSFFVDLDRPLVGQRFRFFSGRQTRFSEYIEQRKALLFYLFVSNKVAKSPVSKTANKPSIYDFSVSRSMRY